jgi:pimeloyl-ACP methyl ester carboxylesterase
VPDAEWEEEGDRGGLPDLSGLAVPTVVAVGDRDLEDFQAVSRWLAGVLPAARLEVLEGAGHLLPLERPEAVAALIARA